MSDKIKTGTLLKRGLAKLKSNRFNCLEITQVTLKRFLGLLYVMVSARRRHIQESLALFHAKRLAEWDRVGIAADILPKNKTLGAVAGGQCLN